MRKINGKKVLKGLAGAVVIAGVGFGINKLLNKNRNTEQEVKTDEEVQEIGA